MVNITFTEHILYKKYLYKVILMPPKDRIKRTIYLATIYRRMKNLYRDTVNWKTIESDQYYYGYPQGKISFFLVDSKGYDYLRKNYKKDIIKLSQPMNEEHLEMLKNGPKTLFRKKLFYNKFRVAIRLKFAYDYDTKKRKRFSPEWNKLKKIIVKSFKAQGRTDGVDYKINVGDSGYGYSNRLSVSILLKDPKDAVILRFKYEEYIRKIETIVLLSELRSMTETENDEE